MGGSKINIRYVWMHAPLVSSTVELGAQSLLRFVCATTEFMTAFSLAGVKSDLSSWLGKRANIPAHHFILSETRALQGERPYRHLVGQQHGSSRKVTLKSSCGHSMVPTARVYAGLCQEIQTASSASGTLSVFARVSNFRLKWTHLHPENLYQGVFLSCVAQLRHFMVQTCSKLPVRYRFSY